jgi:integrase
MKLHAANELLTRLSRRAGQKVTPHMLRHTFGTGAAQAESLDVVAELSFTTATGASRRMLLRCGRSRWRRRKMIVVDR